MPEITLGDRDLESVLEPLDAAYRAAGRADDSDDARDVAGTLRWVARRCLQLADDWEAEARDWDDALAESEAMLDEEVA